MADKQLDRYRSMRDFAKTEEPSGEAKVQPSKRRRFVIQKHDATRLHFDFRLELDGVFKSWAVTKGPSLDPHDRRLAVEVEDHPLDYGDFEGTIPAGQYGGGTVMLWDRGYWEPEPGTDPHEGLRKGDLKVILAGDRLKGGYVLVRMKRRPREKRDNWLLIKHHDGWAQEGHGDLLVEGETTSVASGRTMEAIAAGKGKGPKPFMTGRAGRASAKGVWQSDRAETEPPPAAAPLRAPPPPKLKAAALPGFVPPQLARSVDRPPPGSGWAHEVKFDGYRLQLRVEDGKATLKTRSGLDWTAKFKEIARDAAGLPDCLVDGEACALNHQGAPDFPALQAALSDGKTDDLVFFAFDLLFAEGQDLRPLALRERKARLEAILATPAGGKGHIRYVEHFETGGDAVLQSACRMSLEGIVSKKLDAPYRSDRSDTWLKSKCRAGHEVVIGGWTGEPGQLRSLLVGVHRDGRLVYVGRVGTGFGRDKVARVLPRLETVASDKSPFSGPGAPRKEPNVNWAKPELVAEIEFAGWTGDGNVRQAAFKALREDKPPDQVEAETPAPIGEVDLADLEPRAAAKPKATPRPHASAKVKAADHNVMGVLISNPDKALWPDDGQGRPVTKLDLARYLETVGPWMMQHIKGRPCSVIRTPDGVFGEQRFFQRHAGKGSSALISEVQVFGDHKPYLQVDRIEALAALAQSGAVEFHPWNCQPFQPEVPGRLVFDLDPDEAIPFTRVIEAALEVKERLEALGLAAFCKTTGGKGLHVVTPLKGGKGEMDWPTAKTFAQDVCLAIAADAPDRYVVNMAKAKRVGRIFLDYLRNDRLSTAVAPLSPRAREHAPVSFPLTWNLVKPGLDPKKYTLRTAPALLKKTKAWADYCDAERPLADAIRKLK
ncbi:DNA ligase D [Phenylobacterium hankyongense]|uniref:DNA ligase (ATP) n=1 Tax=Phenylobacterium hankyongense TaxID=1813876 RepID=A0A328AWR4_9CAUL|nr:DNA ligase D [Phenylobacterium hankyongense]RAK59079.1 DNA ligase D [Phenylobacterium hankyongense]